MIYVTDEDDETEDDFEEYESYFSGGCTCEHDMDDHGWTGCDIEGCDCEACWEE